MATFNFKPGLGNAASYQVSGIPWVSGNIDVAATTVVKFPSVTSWVVITNNDSSVCRVGFSAAGVAASNYITVPSGSMSPRLELKVTELHLAGSSDIDVVAGLTAIATVSIDDSLSPSGSNWKGSLEALVG